MIEIVPLTKANHEDFVRINRIVQKTLTNSSWFMPFSEENLAKAFDDCSTFTVYGAVEDGRVVALSLLDSDEGEWGELADALKISGKIVELGGSMVLPEARGRNLMYEINLALLDRARHEKIDYVVATAHPDNLASNRSLQKLGMECKAKIIRAGKYLRNVYIIKLQKQFY